MNREIKFRVVVKEVMYNNLLEISEPLSLEEISYYIKNRKDKDKDCVEEYIFLQFTGLLDKNGKEIWEGDIIKCKYPFDGEAIGEIYFDNMTYKLKSLNQSEEAIKRGYNDFIEYWSDGEYDWDTLEQIMDSEMEVIGNIYQNKNLIN
jgi:uncharacterized phage protein (TIGR01671 family)